MGRRRTRRRSFHARWEAAPRPVRRAWRRRSPPRRAADAIRPRSSGHRPGQRPARAVAEVRQDDLLEVHFVQLPVGRRRRGRRRGPAAWSGARCGARGSRRASVRRPPLRCAARSAGDGRRRSRRSGRRARRAPWGEDHEVVADALELGDVAGNRGQQINPEAWMWYREIIGGNKCPVVDTWWQTETGHIMLTPIPGAIATKPGWPRVRSPASFRRSYHGGKTVPDRAGGFLVLKRPWPGMLRTVYGDPNRYVKNYSSQIPGSISRATAREKIKTGTTGSWGGWMTCSTSADTG